MGFRLLLWTLLSLTAAHATLVPRLSLEQLATESESVVHGTVVRRWAAWGPSRQFIWTHHEVRVVDVLKGRAALTVVVSEPGGEIGDIGIAIAGAPRYEVGQEVVLFLDRTPIGYLRGAGWGQGNFAVVESPTDRSRTVRSAHGGAALIEAPQLVGAPPGVSRTAPASLNGLSVEECKKRLRRLLARFAAGESPTTPAPSKGGRQ